MAPQDNGNGIHRREFVSLCENVTGISTAVVQMRREMNHGLERVWDQLNEFAQQGTPHERALAVKVGVNSADIAHNKRCPARMRAWALALFTIASLIAGLLAYIGSRRGVADATKPPAIEVSAL